jgi:hypothetical protein
MREILECLLQGNLNIPRELENAEAYWVGFFDRPDTEWSKALTDDQITYFEHRCGGRSRGQEVMGYSGFGHLYDTRRGFGENLKRAQKLARAFEKSMCSLEVKAYARDAANFYEV